MARGLKASQTPEDRVAFPKLLSQTWPESSSQQIPTIVHSSLKFAFSVKHIYQVLAASANHTQLSEPTKAPLTSLSADRYLIGFKL